MGFLNRTGLLSSVSELKYSTSVTTNTTLTGNDNWEVFADTTSGPLTITLPAGTKNQKIKIIDSGENAGTNIITIAGTIDGATNTTIEADGEAREFTFNTEWETSGGVDRLFKRTAINNTIRAREPDTFASDKLVGGDPGTTYVGTPANFSQAEANVSQNAGYLGNVQQKGTELTYSSMIAQVSGGVYSDNVLTTLTDVNSSTMWMTNFGTPDPVSIKIDLGTAQEFQILRFNIGNTAYYGRPPSISVYWSDDDSNWTLAETISLTDISQSDFTEHEKYLASPVNHRYIRLTMPNQYNGGDRWPIISEMHLHPYSYATTTNTFQHRILTGGSSASFTPSTFTPKDDTGANLLNGDILIEYSTNGTDWSTQESLTEFKARNNITSTTFWLKFEMVGAKRLGSYLINTVGTYAHVTTNGLEVILNGTSQGNVVVNPMTTAGDLVKGGASGIPERLPVGTEGQVLKSVSGAPAYANANIANDIATQTYTIQNSDQGKTLFFTYAGAVTITCPQSLADTVHVTCVPVGATTTLTFQGDGTSTVSSKDSALSVSDRYGAGTVVHRGSNAWYLFGTLS